ncbi:protein kinase, putative [Plasmodium vinckei petteri]|uniref:Protein kinase, putative n=1 Tax=Plasmodium vinckei petteri TaxID=138298 RepID=A0A6V7SMR9_PLAVN|nr:protein kinase, putative [Plasmodium vinckei petteri]
MYIHKKENMNLHMNNHFSGLNNHIYNTHFNSNQNYFQKNRYNCDIYDTFYKDEVTNFNEPISYGYDQCMYKNKAYANVNNKTCALISMGQKGSKPEKKELYNVNNDAYNNIYSNLSYSSANEFKRKNFNLNNIKILDEEEDNYSTNINNVASGKHTDGLSNNNPYNYNQQNNTSNFRNYKNDITKDTTYNYTKFNRDYEGNISDTKYKNSDKYSTNYNDNNYMNDRRANSSNLNVRTFPLPNQDLSNGDNQNNFNKIDKNSFQFMYNNYKNNDGNLYYDNKLKNYNYNIASAPTADSVNNMLDGNINTNRPYSDYIRNNEKQSEKNFSNFNSDNYPFDKVGANNDDKHKYLYDNPNNSKVMNPYNNDNYSERSSFYSKNQNGMANKNHILYPNLSSFRNKENDENEIKMEKKINLLKNIIVQSPTKKYNSSLNDDMYDSYPKDNLYANMIGEYTSNNGILDKKTKYINKENSNFEGNHNTNLCDDLNSFEKLNETPNVFNKNKFTNKNNFRNDNYFHYKENNELHDKYNFANNGDRDLKSSKDDEQKYNRDNPKGKRSHSFVDYYNNLKHMNMHDIPFDSSNNLYANKYPNLTQYHKNGYENKPYNCLSDSISDTTRLVDGAYPKDNISSLYNGTNKNDDFIDKLNYNDGNNYNGFNNLFKNNERRNTELSRIGTKLNLQNNVYENKYDTKYSDAKENFKFNTNPSEMNSKPFDNYDLYKPNNHMHNHQNNANNFRNQIYSKNDMATFPINMNVNPRSMPGETISNLEKNSPATLNNNAHYSNLIINNRNYGTNETTLSLNPYEQKNNLNSNIISNFEDNKIVKKDNYNSKIKSNDLFYTNLRKKYGLLDNHKYKTTNNNYDCNIASTASSISSIPNNKEDKLGSIFIKKKNDTQSFISNNPTLGTENNMYNFSNHNQQNENTIHTTHMNNPNSYTNDNIYNDIITRNRQYNQAQSLPDTNYNIFSNKINKIDQPLFRRNEHNSFSHKSASINTDPTSFQRTNYYDEDKKNTNMFNNIIKKFASDTDNNKNGIYDTGSIKTLPSCLDSRVDSNLREENIFSKNLTNTDTLNIGGNNINLFHNMNKKNIHTKGSNTYNLNLNKQLPPLPFKSFTKNNTLNNELYGNNNEQNLINDNMGTRFGQRNILGMNKSEEMNTNLATFNNISNKPLFNNYNFENTKMNTDDIMKNKLKTNIETNNIFDNNYIFAKDDQNKDFIHDKEIGQNDSDNILNKSYIMNKDKYNINQQKNNYLYKKYEPKDNNFISSYKYNTNYDYHKDILKSDKNSDQSSYINYNQKLANNFLNSNIKNEYNNNIIDKTDSQYNLGKEKKNYLSYNKYEDNNSITNKPWNYNKNKDISLGNNISLLLEKLSDYSEKNDNQYTNINNYEKNISNNNNNYFDENRDSNSLQVNTINYNDNINIDTNNIVIENNHLCFFGLSTLYRCKLKDQNSSYIVNVVDSIYLNSQNGNDTVANNILFHKRLRHINILPYKGKAADKSKLYLFFENIRGNILKAYTAPIEENIIASYAYQIIDLLEYMHTNFVIFHGLFSNIILLQKNTKEELVQILNEKNKNINKYFDIYKHGIIKVFNFDFSNIDANESDYEFDFYCLATLIYEMCTKYNTYYSNKIEGMYEQIHNTNFFFPHFVSFELKNFCYELCSKKRHCFSDLKKHAWFQKHFNF